MPDKRLPYIDNNNPQYWLKRALSLLEKGDQAAGHYALIAIGYSLERIADRLDDQLNVNTRSNPDA